jgi:hypothetical protein
VSKLDLLPDPKCSMLECGETKGLSLRRIRMKGPHWQDWTKTVTFVQVMLVCPAWATIPGAEPEENRIEEGFVEL